MADLELISFDICPYVERSRIALEYKDVDYEYTEIDLSDKPDWFLEISPRGKVPVLKVDDQPIFESNVINELIEELSPEPAMMPDQPLERARARSWIVFANDELMSHQASVYMGDDEGEQEALDNLEEALAKIDAELESTAGELFLGDDFGLIDTVYAPIFNRWPILEDHGYDDLLDDHDHVREYADTLTGHPAVRAGRDDELLAKMRERF